MKLFDCSRSREAPCHRESSMGPSQNDIMADLKKYCHMYGAEFVDDPSKCDVIITNDVYPKEVLIFDKPRVKRMDDTYWQESLKTMNEPLNKAALQSDCVIFISSYSEWSYLMLYGEALNDSIVILNNANSMIFNCAGRANRMRNKRFTFAASASNWSRSEKRFKNLLEFANNITDAIYLIGKYDEAEGNLPPNIIKMGYLTEQTSMAKVLGQVEAFVNLSYRDPAPKVVCQAVNCGLPVLYANSGGTGEIVSAKGSGVAIRDRNDICFETESYSLDINDIMDSYYRFKITFDDLANKAIETSKIDSFDTLGRYFATFRAYCKEGAN